MIKLLFLTFLTSYIDGSKEYSNLNPHATEFIPGTKEHKFSLDYVPRKSANYRPHMDIQLDLSPIPGFLVSPIHGFLGSTSKSPESFCKKCFYFNDDSHDDSNRKNSGDSVSTIDDSNASMDRISFEMPFSRRENDPDYLGEEMGGARHPALTHAQSCGEPGFGINTPPQSIFKKSISCDTPVKEGPKVLHNDEDPEFLLGSYGDNIHDIKACHKRAKERLHDWDVKLDGFAYSGPQGALDREDIDIFQFYVHRGGVQFRRDTLHADNSVWKVVDEDVRRIVIKDVDFDLNQLYKHQVEVYSKDNAKPIVFHADLKKEVLNFLKVDIVEYGNKNQLRIQPFKKRLFAPTTAERASVERDALLDIYIWGPPTKQSYSKNLRYFAKNL